MPRLPLAFGWERHSVPTSTLWGRRKALGSAARLGSGRNPGDGKSTASRQSRERRGNQRVRPSMVVPGDNKPITIGDGRKERSVYITLERQIKPQPECRKRFSELYPREATGSKEEPAGEGAWRDFGSADMSIGTGCSASTRLVRATSKSSSLSSWCIFSLAEFLTTCCFKESSWRPLMMIPSLIVSSKNGISASMLAVNLWLMSWVNVPTNRLAKRGRYSLTSFLYNNYFEAIAQVGILGYVQRSALGALQACK